LVNGLPLRVERTFRASAEEVFDAWTSVEVLRRWWPAGPDWTNPVAEVDLRVGGRLRLVMRDVEGVEYGGGGRYVVIERPTRLVFTWQWDDPSLRSGEQRVEVMFTANPGGSTTVVLVNHGLTDDVEADHDEGWRLSFDNLDRVLAQVRP
jgi:uncharacterized protein YndB with AHSA1/START domain